MDSFVDESNTILLNFMGIIIELSGLEEKEKAFFDIPKPLKRIKFINDLWKKYRPETKKIIVKNNLSDYINKGKNLSFFQKCLIKKS